MPSPTWDFLLRRQLKLEQGKGWSISPQSGRVKLTRRESDGSRSSVMLDIPWAASSASKVMSAVGALRQRMESRGISLRAAHELHGQSPVSAEGSTDWEAIRGRFLSSLGDRKPRTVADIQTRIDRALACLAARPAPRDGSELMAAYERLHLAKLKSGSEGRRRNLQDVARFLSYAVQECGAPAKWMPVIGAKRRQLIGAADGRASRLTPPIKPDQLAMLLDQLESDGRHELRLAVGLVGLYGLRPAELATLRMDGQRLLVGQVKRTPGDMRKSTQEQARAKERLVLPLDLPGKAGLGQQMAAQWASCLVKLPPQILTAIESRDLKLVGDALRQYLNRCQPWRNLVSANPGMTVYSLRHGFAWRAHKTYSRSLSIRDTAALMGHAPEIHCRYYGRWVDEHGLINAVAALTKTPSSLEPVF